MERIPYPSDLTDEQWRLIEPWIPSPKPGGRPRSVDLREVVKGSRINKLNVLAFLVR
jgi:putative transposase